MSDIEPLDRAILITFFNDKFAEAKRQASLTPRALAKLIAETSAVAKDHLPWLKLAIFGDKRTPKTAHSKGNSLRHDANVTSVTGCELDYDAGKISFDDARGRLETQGVACILYTSPSYSIEFPKWRILCPFSREGQPHVRRQMVGRVNGLFGGVFLRENWALSQAYYFGAVNRSPLHRVELIDGSPIDDHDELDEIWIGPANADPEPPAGGNTDEREIAELVRLIVTGRELHNSLTPLAARLVGRCMPAGTVAEVLRGLMQSWPDTAKDERWHARYAEIDRLVGSAIGKYQAPAEQRKEFWPRDCVSGWPDASGSRCVRRDPRRGNGRGRPAERAAGSR